VKQRGNFRCYPTPEQERILARTFGCTRFVYNRFLHERTAAFQRGERIANPRHLNRYQRRMARIQKGLARETKSSNRRCRRKTKARTRTRKDLRLAQGRDQQAGLEPCHPFRHDCSRGLESARYG
jgi:transposase